MKNQSSHILIGLTASFFIFSCMEKRESESVNTSDTIKTIAPDTSQPKTDTNPAALKAQTFENAYNDIISAIRREEFDKVDKYIDSTKGYFLITRVDNAPFFSYQHGDHFADLSGGEGPEAERASDFLEIIKNADPDELKLQDSGKEDMPVCTFTKKGAFKISLRKVKPVYSQDYSIHKQGGNETDQDLLQGLTEMEGSFTTKVYLSRLAKEMNYAQTLYFSEFNDKVYLVALDLTSCK
jgi:hypothetical protein